MRIAQYLTIAVLVTFPGAGLLQAAFQDPGFSARPAGMGGAFAAIADDAGAALWNPAGLAGLENRSAVFSYAKPFLDLEGVNIGVSWAAYAHPLGPGAALSAGWARTDTDGFYQEDIFIAAYGRRFAWCDAGISLKYLSRAVRTDERSQDDPVFANGTSRGAAALDAGLLRRWSDRFSAGLALRNINRPDAGFADKDPVPFETALGASYAFPQAPGGKLVAALDTVYREGAYDIRIGGELWLRDESLALRAGGNRGEISLGGSYLYPLPNTDITLGTHYAFSLPTGIQGSAGSHRLAIDLAF